MRFLPPLCAAWLLPALALVPPTALAAQDPSPPEWQRRMKSETISLSVLLQVLAEREPSSVAGGVSGFRIPNARVVLGGRLAERRVSYLLQANVATSPSLLDLVLGYHPASALALEMGQFKAPFSLEALTGAGALEFTERAPVVTALAPGRQVGAQLRLDPAPWGSLAVGAFNGNGQGRLRNDGRGLLLAGRLLLTPVRRPDQGAHVTLGLQAATSRDSAAPIGTLAPAFAGRRILVGADLRVEWAGWLLAGEGIGSSLDSRPGGTRYPFGWYVTGGRTLGRTVELLARWERLITDGLGVDEDLLLVGGQYRPDAVVRVRLHYGIPVGSAPLGRHRLVGGMQVSF